ncbi:MAG: hypothetical protein SFY32_09740 [Bacteroidota bacterium]|nr:hypothetical protein [Bacteroidota bacterium]
MKKAFLIITSLICSITLSMAQETASGGEGKKMFLGVSGNMQHANVPNWGGGLSFEYFVSNKISVNFGYQYSFSESRNNLYTNSNGVIQPIPETKGLDNLKTQTHLHNFNLIGRYYILGGNDAAFGMYAGAGLGFGWNRSNQFTSDYKMGTWRGIYLVTNFGGDFAVGPGRLFAEGGINPRLYALTSYEKTVYFISEVYVNLGYKIGF